MNDGPFVMLSQAFCRRISPEAPLLLYDHDTYWVRRLFWSRLVKIDALIRSLAVRRERCLDLGGGSGAFLPTLSKRFDTVTCIDLDTRLASVIKNDLGLDNVELLEMDARSETLSAWTFDALVATDVLEHFQDLNPIVSSLERFLALDGLLFTSLPSENWFYLLLRRIFGITKPEDHYHSAAEVEAYLTARGFRLIRQRFVPFRLLALFHITAWQFDTSVDTRR